MSDVSRRRSILGLIAVMVIIAMAFSLLWQLYNNLIEKKKQFLEDAVNYIKSDYKFASIFINSNDGRKISFLLTIYNQDGNPAGKKLLEISGGDIFLESKVIVIDSSGVGKAFVFPEKIYSDSIPPEKGIDLTPIYVTDGYPQNYSKVRSGDGIYKGILSIYNISRGISNEIYKVKGNNLKIMLDMDASLHKAGGTEFMQGRNYICSVHPGGGLELEEEK